ncbi:hypothetical protein CDAR_394401 [Caerostris darwini]|uniref:Uncharacterized protein n=1 Tax=Caerostris darwini TaxID=1538125 RepID=A0AAV4RI20_9ARAC|nr:hypothetical protein CDAR_394401 [Caerostris darwini]
MQAPMDIKFCFLIPAHPLYHPPPKKKALHHCNRRGGTARKSDLHHFGPSSPQHMQRVFEYSLYFHRRMHLARRGTPKHANSSATSRVGREGGGRGLSNPSDHPRLQI